MHLYSQCYCMATLEKQVTLLLKKGYFEIKSFYFNPFYCLICLLKETNIPVRITITNDNQFLKVS